MMLESFVFIAPKPPRLKTDRRMDKSVLVYSYSEVCSTGNVNDLEPHLSSLMSLESPVEISQLRDSRLPMMITPVTVTAAT